VTFGEWLKRHRAAMGLTQKQLSHQINCSVSTLRKLETEDRRPSAQVVEQLAEIFDIPQNERKAFLQFARGDWQAFSAGSADAFWQNSLVTSLPDLPRPMEFLTTQEDNRLVRSVPESSNITGNLALIHQALEAAESFGDQHRQLEYLWQLGWMDQANRFIYWEKALVLARLLENTEKLTYILNTMGLFLVLNGDINSGQKYLAESTIIYQQSHPKSLESSPLQAYGQLYLIQGDFEKARFYLQEQARRSLESGYRQEYLWSRVRLGYVAQREGNLTEARQIFSEVAQEFQKDKTIIGVIFSMEGLAGLYIEAGNEIYAARLVGWADSMRVKISNTRPLLEQADVDKIIAACLEKMGEIVFAEAYTEGKKMTLDEAVTFALNE